ncbi:unnamed protein product [Durusdinium trenchii]|uniref:Uncharacterized protein n=1 Tax=Durusdinium trenchii TaxID=1381693 RepID=A0ABP0LP29_9DINO
MNQSLQILLSQNGPGASEVAAELKDLLENTLKASVLAAKDSLQTELSNHYAKGFDACDAVLAAAQGSDGAVATKQASFETSRAKHVSCRTLEAESKTTFDACAEEEEKLKVAKESACKVVADLNAITHGNSVRENGETYSAFSGRMEVYYEAEKEKALAAEEKCNKASEDFETKVSSCSALKSSWTGQKTTCDEEQDLMDATSCQILEASNLVCTEYATCNEQATASYKVDQASVETQEGGLKHEWMAVLQMECQLSVFTTASKDKKTALTDCVTKDYTTEVDAAIKLQYPSPIPRAAKACEKAAGTAGAAAYEEANYKGLPSDAPAKACSAECCTADDPASLEAKKITDPILANLAGEWSVHYSGWSRNFPFQWVKITCDGSWTIWNGVTSKVVLSGPDFDKLCPKRTVQPQFLVPKWAGTHKWECGWYDAELDTFGCDHYVPRYWGWLNQAKRVKKYECP